MNTNKHLIISGILFTIVLFLWPIFLVRFSQPKGTIIEQLNWISNNTLIYKMQFIFSLLVSPAIIYLMLSQLNKFQVDNRIASKIGLVFLTGYFVLNSVAYASQIILVPQFIESGLIEQAQIWYFNSSFSVSYFINQMGYCFWALGAIILFTRLISEKGMIKYLSLIYILSAILSIIAFTGLILDNKTINSMTLYSGLVLVPIGIMTIIWGLRENKINSTQQ